jgi:acyl-coenzyme A synthetase/AMP-(fatty) acid ligase/acyl carrier protein
MRLAALGGDRVEWSHFDDFRRVCARDGQFACHLGSTECSTLYAEWFVDDAYRGDGDSLPVGRPLPDRAVALIGEDGAPVADGEVGEFVVSSRFIARGYWRNPELTAKAFSRDPCDPEARVYRTGDLGRLRPDGLYEFAGRRDHQLNLHGHRVELGEVEASLKRCAGVRDGAIVVRRGPDGAPRALIAYVELEPDVRGLEQRHLMAMLGHRLPAYMVPAGIVMMDELPRLPSFKVDRPALDRLEAARGEPPAPGDDPLLAKVARAFETALNVEGATGADTLVTLGGDSLQAVDVVLELERTFGIDVPLDTFQQSQSIAELAAWIAERRSPTE